jgi:GTP-binding protein Era
MVDVATESVKEVDVALFLVEATEETAGAGDTYIIEQLKTVKTPVVLIINKVDSVKKETILALIKNFSELMNFKGIIPISALKGEGIDIVLDEVSKLLPEGPQYFPEDMLTDQPEKVIVAEMIREKLLNLLKDEIPHGTGVEVMTFKERPGRDIIDIQATIYCEKDSHKGIIIGKQGAMLKKIGSMARNDVEKFLGTKVFLELWVKVKSDWRNSNAMLKTLGYTK